MLRFVSWRGLPDEQQPRLQAGALETAAAGLCNLSLPLRQDRRPATNLSLSSHAAAVLGRPPRAQTRSAKPQPGLLPTATPVHPESRACGQIAGSNPLQSRCLGSLAATLPANPTAEVLFQEGLDRQLSRPHAACPRKLPWLRGP